ncbi:patched domain-containing protein 3-like [Centruroides sculpturatus]|uniref:patched domain-containing protein 3-like n=1 Tax=Centruroides sculpturatus TaxID=218467 RepID=UPI000C6D03E8|nr:patched domain-containing protein 3-like [Centruroides sculpturatus]
MTNSWIKSKPLLGLASVINAGLAVSSSFGLMAALGVEFTYWNATIPFLVLVTEIDDAFVLIACWRITDPKHSIQKRMEVTYGEAGVSITLTSLTNSISYYIGMMAPFSFIRIFSYYTATCVVLNFVYQITFFGGCLAISGYREQRNLRSKKFVRCEQNDEDNENNNAKEEEFTMAHFRDSLGKIISNPIVFYYGKTLRDLLKIAENSEIPVLVHCILSGFIEQGIIIGEMIQQLFWITAILIAAVFLLFVPNLLVAITVAISVVSAMVETLGYMSFWGVNLDIISMMSLILCVGFSLNYPAHISYAYVMSQCETPNEKLKDSLYRIGFPILQGSLTTGIGIGIDFIF